MSSMDEKRKLALTYLKDRGKYIVSPDSKFTPSDATNTDIRATIERYRREVLDEKPAVYRKRGRV